MALGFPVNLRSVYLSAIISVICGVLLFFLFRFFTPLEVEVSGEGYAILAVEELYDERFILEILADEGLENIISKSSQFVPIDDFGVLRMVQLDLFHTEIAYFDPRDTGYAAKLQNFFVHGGNRFFFIPMGDAIGDRTVNLPNMLTRVLEDIPFSLAVFGQRRPFHLYFALIALACVFTLFFSRSRRQFIFQFPVLLAMGWGGFSATVFAAFLCGIWELLREPFGELSLARRSGRSAFDYAGAGLKGLVERLRPYRKNLFLASLFLLFLLVLSYVSDISPFPLAAATFFFFLLYFLSFHVERERAQKNKHIPFQPVLLYPVKLKTFSLFPFLLPFAAVSIISLFLPRLSPDFSHPYDNAVFFDKQYFVTADDYYRHITFQKSFSLRSLHTLNGYGPFNQDIYMRYYLGDDGLITGSIEHPGLLAEIPPFPLEKLVEFLINYDNEAVRNTAGDSMNAKEWISVAIILAACFIDMIRPRMIPKKKLPVLGDKRIAA
jgi:hypothetical protein